MSALRSFALLLLVLAGWSADAPVEVSPAVAAVLAQVRQESDPAKAEVLLTAYTGAPSALLALALGNARLQRADAAPENERAALRAKARDAYATAVQLAPRFTAAHIGLARCAALAGDWKAALDGCAAGIQPATAEAPDLAFFVDCAARAGDRRLAANLVSQAMVRYPSETIFRRQELALLVAAERWEEARSALLALLEVAPTDADAWRSLAGTWSRAGGDDGAARIALEAALLLKPDDTQLRRALAEAQLAAGQAPAALATVQPLIADPLQADPRLVEFAARAAMESDRSEQARRWLAVLPSEKRSRAGQLLMARLAAQSNDLAAADAALQAVLRQGESDPAVLTWAGAIAERAGDLTRAESLYRLADAQAPGPATLRLGLLLHRAHRVDEAKQVLAAYRQAYPADPQLAIVDQIIGR